MRSRGSNGKAGPGRDLIEAGLSEAAGWGNGLWGLWLRQLAREADAIEPKVGCRGSAMAGDGGYGRRIRAPAGPGAAPIAIVAWRRIDTGPFEQSALASAWGTRSRGCGAVGSPGCHEVSYQKDGRHGCGRCRVARMVMAPPQHGQRS